MKSSSTAMLFVSFAAAPGFRRVVRVRRRRWCRRHGILRLKCLIEIEAPGKRRMLPRHLLVFGLLPHVVAHGDEKIAQAVSGIRHMSYERARKGRVTPCSVERHISRLLEKLISVP